MADETDLNTGEAPVDDTQESDSGVSQLDAFHIHGKGNEALDDAQEQDLSSADITSGDDLIGNANVQSGRRDSFESILESGVAVGSTVGNDAEVSVTPSQRSETDTSVDSNFEAPPVAFTSGEIPNTTDGNADAPPAGTPTVQNDEPSDLPIEQNIGNNVENVEASALTAADAPTPDAPTPTDAPDPDTDPTEENDPVAQTPNLTLTPASGYEDLPIKLDIVASSADSDGGRETLSVTISDVPAGFSFVDGNGDPIGSQGADGSWTFSAADIEDLYLSRPQHYSGDVNLEVTVTASEFGSPDASTTQVLTVHVEAIADAPNLAATDSAGTENTWIDLDVTTSLVDTDGSESVSVYVTGVPDGADLSMGTKLTADVTLEDGTTFPAGTWVISGNDIDNLGDLQVKPPVNSSDDFQLSVYAASTEASNGDVAVTGPATINVDVGVVDPSLSGSGAGNEDEWTALDLSSSVNAADGTETLTVTLTNLSDGALLRNSETGQILTPNADGSYTITDQLDKLEVRWDPTTNLHDDTDIEFDLTATVDDVDVGTSLETDRDSSTTTTHVTVDIAAVADAPDLATSDSAGTENTWIDLDITTSLVDTDGSESVSVYVVGVPDGAELSMGTMLTEAVTLEDGTTFPAGTWVVSGSDIDNLDDLQVKPAENSSDDFQLSVYAASTESSNGDVAVTGPATINVDVGVVDPTLTGSGSGNEDEWTALDLTASVNAADGTETLTVTLTNLSEGAILRDSSTGTVLTPNADGSYTISDNFDSLEVRWDPTTNLHDDADIEFDITATVDDVDVGTSLETDRDSSTVTTHVTVDIAAVADAPELATSDSAGTENTWIDLDITTSLVDTDGSESETVYVVGVPDGADLSMGTMLTEAVTLEDGTTFPAGTWVISGSDLDNLGDLQVKPPANSSDDFQLSVYAAATESSNGDVSVTGPATINVDVGVVDPSLSASGAGNEDEWTALDLSASVNASDGTETLTVTLTNLSEGAILRDSSTGTVLTPNADGSYTVSDNFDSLEVRWDPTTNLHDDADIEFDITATVDDVDVGTSLETDRDSSSVTTHVTVDIAAVADAPDLATTDSAGTENTWIDLDITTSLVDTDGSESETVYVVGVPDGADLSMGTMLTAAVTLEDGTTFPAGTWVISGSDLDNLGDLQVKPPANSSDDFQLSVYAAATESSNGDVSVTGPATINVDVGVVDPSLSASGAGNEDEWTALDLSASVNASDGTETLTVTLTNLSDGAILRDSSTGEILTPNADGSYTITDKLDSLEVRWNPDTNLHDDTDITFDVTATVDDVDVGTSLETDRDSSSTTTHVTVDIAAVADAPTLSTGDVGVYEHDSAAHTAALADTSADEWVTLDVDVSLVDNDGSESLTVYIEVPAGATLSHGSIISSVDLSSTDGDSLTLTSGSGTVVWEVPVSAIESGSLKLLPAADSSADLDLNVTLVSTETRDGQDQAWVQSGMHVDVGVLTPEVDAGAVSGDEDTWIKLDLTAELPTEGNDETLVVSIEDLPEGAILATKNGSTYSEITDNGDGTYTITGSLDNVYVRWDADTDLNNTDDITFTLKAYTSDVDVDGDFDAMGSPYADEAVATTSVTVTVNAVADDAVASGSAVGIEDTEFALDLNVSAANESETVTVVTLTGMPTGASLYFYPDGTGDPSTRVEVLANGDGEYELDVNSLHNYTVVPAADSDADFTLTMSVTTQETSNGDTNTVTYDVPVTVYSDADTPTLTTDDPNTAAVNDEPVVTINEDSLYQLVWGSNVSGHSGEGDTGFPTSADGSEEITVRIELVDADGNPVDASDAILVVDGVTYTSEDQPWIVDGADLVAGNVSLGGVDYWASDSGGSTLRFKLTPIATDDDGEGTIDLDGDGVADRSVTAEGDPAYITLQVDAVANTVTMTAENSGLEDAGTPFDTTDGIAMTPTITLQDTDGSESLTGSVFILSSDQDMVNGTVTLNGSEVTPQLVTGYDADGNPTFDGSEAADSPPVYAYEISVSDFSYDSASSTYSINGLSLTPPEHSDGGEDGDVRYSIVATTVEEGNGDTQTTTFTGGVVHIEAVADLTTITGHDAAGMEDSAIALSIDSGGLVDTDGSETLTIYISGVPKGAVISQDGTELTANADGTITLEDGTTLVANGDHDVYAIVIKAGESVEEALANLTITPPEGDSADFKLTLTAVTEEQQNGDQAIASSSIWVDVGTYGPTLSDGAVTINEWTYNNGTQWNSLNLSNVIDLETSNRDGTETVEIHLTDIPDGVTLRAYYDGGWHTLSPNSDGAYVIDEEWMNSVSIRTARNDDTDFTLKAQAVLKDVDVGESWENDASDTVAPDSAYSDIVDINVTVNAVADGVIASGSGVGVEDQWIDLDLDVALRDTDGSEAITSIILDGDFTGVTLRVPDGSGGFITLSPNGNGDYDLTNLTEEQWDGLQIMAPADSNEDLSLTLRTTTTDYGTDGDVSDTKGSKTTNTTVKVTVFGDADTPTVTVDENTKTIVEDQVYKLSNVVTDPSLGEDMAADGVTSADGSETLTLVITPVDADHSRLGLDTDGDGKVDTWLDLDDDGTWTISADQLDQVYIGGVGDWAGADSSDTLQFKIVARATEDDADADDSALDGVGLSREGSADSTLYTVTLAVDPVADALVISAHNEGVEDQVGGIAVTPTIAVTDTDGSESLTGTVYIMTSDADMLDGELSLDGNTLTPQLVTGYDADGNPTFDGGVAADSPPVYAYSIDSSDFSASGTTYSISGLVFTPAENSDGDVTYKIAATVNDNGDHLTTIGSGSIIVDAVADAPTVDVASVVTGTEDTPILLGISAELTDTDGSETLTGAQITDVPDGWTVGYWDGNTFVEATNEGNGVWTVSPDRLSEVAVLPDTDLHVDLADAPKMSLTVTSSEGAADDNDVSLRSASTTTTFSVVVEADADTPSVVITNARGSEDTDIAIDILAKITDSDLVQGRDEASESLTVTISGDFKGGTLVDGDGNELTYDADQGGYVVTADQLDDIYFRPLADSNEDLQLTITATSTEASNGDTATKTATMNVNVKGVADAATYGGEVLSTTGAFEIDGTEGKDGAATEINPHFEDFGSTDTDGSETVSLVIKDIADGVHITMTAGNEEYLSYIGNGQWAVDPDHLGDVRITVTDSNYSGSLTDAFKLDVVVTENDGDVAVTSKSVTLNIDPTTDTPSISLSGSVIEDASVADGVQQDIAVQIAVSPADIADGVESITGLTISVDTDALGLPPGTTVTFTLDGVTYDLTAGESITLDESALAAYTDSNGAVHLDLTLDGLPENWSTDVPVTISATAQEDGADAVTSTVTKSVVITADADAPASFTADPQVSSGDDNVVELNVDLTLADTDGSEEVTYFTVTGVPAGAVLTAGTYAGNGTWVITYDQYQANGLAIEGDAGVSGDLTITAHIKDSDPDGGSDQTTASISTSFAIGDDAGSAGGGTGGSGGSPTSPTVAINPVNSDEDASFSLSLNTSDTDGSSAIIIDALPEGMTIHGTLDVDYFVVDGSIVIPLSSLDNVTFTPDADYSGDLAMTISITGTDGTTSSQSLDVTDIAAYVAPVTDGANISATVVAGADTSEDTSGVAFTVTIAQQDDDYSEKLDSTSVTIDGNDLPDGSVLSLNGTVLTANADGTYTIPLSDFGVNGDAFESNGSITLNGLSVTPPADYSGALNLSFSVEVHDEGTVNGTTVIDDTVTSTGSLSINITPETDTAVLDAQNVTGAEDTAITLDLSAFDSDVRSAVNDYGSESMSVVISGVPAGAVLSGATNNGEYVVDGVTYTSWTIKGGNIDPETGEITGVTYTAPEDWSGTLSLTMTAYTMELSTQAVAVASSSFDVTVTPVSDLASINPQNVEASAEAREDSEVPLTLNAQLLDVDGSETLTVQISGVPDGATFTDGNGNAIGTALGRGLWSFTAAEAATVHIVGAKDYSGTLELQAQAISQDGAADAVSSGWTGFTVTLLGQADDPTLTLGSDPVGGSEDQNGGIALNIEGALNDTEGESLQLVISGAPEGTTFTAVDGTVISATVAADGSLYWAVEGDDISGLVMNTPLNWNGTVDLGLDLIASEDGTQAHDTATLSVTVDAVNDAPVVDVTTAASYNSGYDGPLYVVANEADNTAGVAISDVDDTTLSHMDVSITSGAQEGDSLSIYGQTVDLDIDGNLSITVDGSTLSVTYDVHSNTLSFDGDASADTYAKVAGSVVLTSSTGTVEEGTRSISVTTYDDDGLSGTDSTTASVQNGSIDLDGADRGEILFSGNNSVTLLGSDGTDDALVMSFGDPLTTIDGGTDGFDQLYIMPGNENPDMDWTITAGTDSHGNLTGDFTITGGDGSDNMLVHVDPSHVASVSEHAIVFDDDASGTITFDDGSLSSIDFTDLEKISV
jgi:hypothetical protein